MRIAVCEANCSDMQILMELLKVCFERDRTPPDLFGYFGGEDLLCDVGRAGFDVIFLADEDDLAQTCAKLRREGFAGQLILCGERSRLAAEGYALGACAFLQKPVSQTQLKTALSVASAGTRQRISLFSGGRFFSIPLDEITFIESRRNACLVHTTRGSLRVGQSMTKLSALLGEAFLRCHKSYIVNMYHILSVSEEFLLDSGDRVMIRKSGRHAVMDRFAEYSLHDRR